MAASDTWTGSKWKALAPQEGGPGESEATMPGPAGAFDGPTSARWLGELNGLRG